MEFVNDLIVTTVVVVSLSAVFLGLFALFWEFVSPADKRLRNFAASYLVAVPLTAIFFWVMKIVVSIFSLPSTNLGLLKIALGMGVAGGVVVFVMLRRQQRED